MNDFRSERGNEVFVAVEGFAVGQVDAVLIGPKIRVPRAVVHRDANAFEEQFRRGGCFADRPCACQCPFGRAIDLRLVEDDKAPSKEAGAAFLAIGIRRRGFRSEEHTSELQSLMRISYAVFCLKTKK